MAVPLVATYRVQLSQKFGFMDLIDKLDYLRSLGISHVYLSPVLKAAKGSLHCYDTVDCTRINEELGGEEGFHRLSRELAARGMGMLLDVVPNHMSIDSADNVWWQDILENGPSSLYASFFDIDWHLQGNDSRVLAPILPDHYGRVLETGGIRLEREAGTFYIHTANRRMPVAPESVGGLLREACGQQSCDELDFVGRSLQALPRPEGEQRDEMASRDRDKRLLYDFIQRLLTQQPELSAAIDAVIGEVDADLERLDRLICDQRYRLAYWRVAAQQLGYRRFFDVNTLVALRADMPEVFGATHGMLLRLHQSGLFDSMRVDHIDGIRKPLEYLTRLRDAAPDLNVFAEKILQPDENLPCSWQIEGTTGYDFMFEAGNLFVDRSAESTLTALYEEVTGDRRAFEATAKDAKLQALRELFGSDIRRLLTLFEQICEERPRDRDYLRSELKEALELFIAALPVYRTYVDPENRVWSTDDKTYVESAAAKAKKWAPDIDPELFHLLTDLMLLRAEGGIEANFVMRLQQLSGAAAAKGIEDTAFYRYHRLTALNEVGGDPSRFGIEVTEFHRRAEKRRSRMPRSLLATSTHDTKRSEDVRIRICGLTAIPELWSAVVRRWFASHAGFRSEGYPDAKIEYLFYQTVVGAWPIDVERTSVYVLKAAREAKEHTSWTRQDATYEKALKRFVEKALGDEQFRRDVENLVRKLLRPSRIASLAQVLIKLTSPGVPDLYQGTELWHHYLVDPDNRSTVDYESRRRLLREIDELSVEQVLEQDDAGTPKLWLVRQALRVRRERPSSFGPEGTYTPLETAGDGGDYLVAFARGDDVAVLAPRLPARVAAGWGGATVNLPEGQWQDRLGGNQASGGWQPVEPLLLGFPVALYVREVGT